MVRSTARQRLAITAAALALSVTACSSQAPEAEPAPPAEPDEPIGEEPPGLGEWAATCTEVDADSAALEENLTGGAASADPSDLPTKAEQAVTPLADCEPGFLADLADHLPGAWADGDLAAAAAEAILALNPEAAQAEIEHFTPFNADGQIRFAVEDLDPGQPFSGYLEGSCHASPVASADDVYQCGTTAHNLAACWRADAYSFGPVFACMHSPDDESVVFVQPTEGDPEPAEAEEDPSPWQVILEDGSNCRVRLGGAWPGPPEGTVWSHGCEGGQIAALVLPEGGSTLETEAGGLVALGAAEVEPTAEVVPTRVEKVVYAGETIEPPAAQSGTACPPLSELEPALREINDTWSFLEEPEPECVGDWVLAFAGDEMSANTQVFEKVEGSWVGRDSGEECTLPSTIPASLYALHCMAG